MKCLNCDKETPMGSYCKECRPFTRQGGGLNRRFFLVSLSAAISMVILVLAAQLALEAFVAEAESTALYTVLSFVLIISYLYLVVVMLAAIYQMWSLIQDGYARTTPGKAVGFLFIPFFNIYWVFQSVWGFSKDYNRYIKRYAISTAPLPEKLFLAFAIISLLSLIPVIGWVLAALISPILFIIMTFKICESVELGAVGKLEKSLSETVEGRPGRSRVTTVFLVNSFQRLKGRPWKTLAVIAASIAVMAIVVNLLFPRANFVLDALTFPDQVVAGDDFVVSVKLQNTGRGKGSRTLAFSINEVEYLFKEVFLAGGLKETVIFEIEGALTPGVYQVGIDDLIGNVRILKPAEFELSNFKLSPTALRVGEQAELSVNVANLGEVEGSYTLSLNVDGEARQTEVVTLKGESSTKVTFPIVKDQPGNYEVRLNNLNESLQIWQIERPGNGTVLVNKLKGGHGHLRIRNKSDEDCVIALASPSHPNEALLLVYVRSKSNHTVKSIKNGTYMVYLATGEDWDSYSRRFTKNAYHEKFEQTAKYASKYPRYDIITIELGVTDGTARTERVPAHEFPQ
jgi:hypothetical protein